MMNATRRNNYLKGVMVDGNWVHEPALVNEEVKTFFSNRYQESDYHRPTLEGICFQKLNQHQNDRLTARFQEEEVKNVV